MNVTFFSQANESGIIQFIKRPGAVLENGSIIAKLALDDPAQCCRVEQYQGPGFDSLRFSDSKLPLDLHQNYLKTKQILENSLDGYCPGDEKFFKEYIGAIIKDYLTFLHDPRLPLDETREALASIQGRIQPK